MEWYDYKIMPVKAGFRNHPKNVILHMVNEPSEHHMILAIYFLQI